MTARREFGRPLRALGVAALALACRDAGGGIHAARYVNATDGWAVGAAGLVLRTVDGGKRWARGHSGVSSDLRTVAIARTRDGRYVGVAAGDGGVLLRTLDGSAWSRADICLSETLRAAAAGEAGSLLLVAGDAGTLLRSEDFGASWTSVPLGSANVREVKIDDEAEAVLATDDAGGLWESRNGARHFELVSGPKGPLARNFEP